MKRILLLAVLASGLLPPGAFAMCYTVYGPNAVVVWRGTNTPIDLSLPISQGMRKVFPAGTFLVIDDENRGCSPVGPQDFFGSIPGMNVK